MAQWNEETQRWEYAPGELDAQVEAALASEAGEGGTQGLHIRYSQTTGLYRVDLSNGVSIQFPARLVEGLAGKSVPERRDVHILPDGDTLEWGRLDLHLSLSGLMAGSFGSATWNAQVAANARKEAAAHAGRATSPRKAASSKANGQKGGRPRKQGNPPQEPGRSTRRKA